MSDSRGRILVVEDHDDSRDLLVAYFEGVGFDVVPVVDAAAGLAELRRGAFDCIVTDYTLTKPEETGTWMIERAADEGVLRGVAAIVLATAHPNVVLPPGVRLARKPLDLDALRRSLDESIAAARASRRSSGKTRAAADSHEH